MSLFISSPLRSSTLLRKRGVLPPPPKERGKVDEGRRRDPKKGRHEVDGDNQICRGKRVRRAIAKSKWNRCSSDLKSPPPHHFAVWEKGSVEKRVSLDAEIFFVRALSQFAPLLRNRKDM